MLNIFTQASAPIEPRNRTLVGLYGAAQRLLPESERSSQIQTPADIIRRHRDEHARDWLTSALEMVLEEGTIEPVLQRFLPTVA